MQGLKVLMSMDTIWTQDTFVAKKWEDTDLVTRHEQDEN